jgi:creatinine amidohydrolase
MFISYTAQTQASLPGKDAVAILPLAAMETHGPHLPLGTDGLIAEGILDHAARRDQTSARFLRLPLLWLGASAEHADRPGTLSMSPEQLIGQIESVGEGLARAGIQRVVLFNGHGGNIAASQIAALKLRTRFGMLAASAHWLDFGLPETLVPPGPAMADVHGGWVETSVLLCIAPKLVVQKAIAPRPAMSPVAGLFPTGPIAWGWKLDDLSDDKEAGGWIGRPDLATPAIGQQLLDHAADKLLGLLSGIAHAKWSPTS